MKAPGTEKRTTFLPFHSSVEYLTAIEERRIRSVSIEDDRVEIRRNEARCDYVRIPQAVRLSVSGV